MRTKICSIFALLNIFIDASLHASIDDIWDFLGTDASAIVGNQDALPSKFALFSFDKAAFLKLIENISNTGQVTGDIEMPLPDGSFEGFVFSASEVMHRDLALLNPDIKTFRGWQTNDASVISRFDIAGSGFHAQIHLKNGLLYVSPLTENIYISYYARDYLPLHDFSCELGNRSLDVYHSLDDSIRPLINYGTILRSYRVAVAATGEYTQAVGGTKSQALASIATAINFLNGTYELEVGVRLILIANNANIIYTNPATDPYTPEAGNNSMLAQNQTTVDSVIGPANYDIGHVVHARSGTGNSASGVAFISSVCRLTSKARGVTTASRIGLLPINPFFYRVLLHEIGHQFGAHHSFNSSCNGNRTATTAYEPGGGSTIMSYAGGCAPYNVQTLADTYFHRISLEEISSFLALGGSSCDVVTNTGNSVPNAEAGANYTIPKGTPFVLTGVGADTDPNALTYGWEQYDREIAPMPPLSTSLIGPNFRSFTPALAPNRYFPRLQDILANKSPTWEVLPTVGRTLHFSLVVRDNVGGADSDDMTVTINAASGPFVVTSPNGGEVGIGLLNVTWNTANTAAPPVSTAQVDILLSVDNGNTFPIVLANNTPNDGSQTVLLPSLLTNLARIQVRAEGNIFFDISNAPFSIGLIASEEKRE